MDTGSSTSIAFTLTSAAVAATVEVRLRGDGERWLATATIDGTSNTAIARTAPLALAAALASLPAGTVRALLADIALYGPSAELARRIRHPA